MTAAALFELLKTFPGDKHVMVALGDGVSVGIKNIALVHGVIELHLHDDFSACAKVLAR